MVATLATLIGAALAAPSFATPWNPMTSAVAIPSKYIPGPKAVPGKDISNVIDYEAPGGADAEQDIAWDGLGGVRDSFDYSLSRVGYPDVNDDRQVDAIANGGDALYHEVIADQAALLFSVSNYPNIMVEPINIAGGSGAAYVWATSLQIDDMNPPVDVDGLEVWGGDQLDDTDRYSLVDDPFAANAMGKVAVWAYAGGVSTPHILTTDLAAAIDLQYFGVGVGGPAWSHLVELMDVDAIMANFGADGGNNLLFSIAPLDLSQFSQAGGPLLPTFDGGEIFVYTSPTSPTSFLRHGGHLWDTTFDVMNTFNLPSENVNALEAVAAVPEPSSIVLALLGVACVVGCSRRRRS
jgi:hypothetical protein